MSGHTFKVGDRVSLVSTVWKDTGTLLAVGELFAWVMWDDNDGEPTTEQLATLRLLPLFEPVERWMPLDDGELDWSTYSAKGSAGRTWVKVIISPAEDQS